MTTVVGLTGSIGMGKSTVAQMLREMDVPVFDADAEVHALYSKGGAAVEPVGARFPGVVVDGAICRAELSKRVVGDAAAISSLEALVHPLLQSRRDAFLAAARAAAAPLAALDVPLLYEKGLHTLCDAVLVVSAPADVQRARVLSRPAMAALPPDAAAARFEAILSRQMPDEEKRAQPGAVVIDTGGSLEQTRAAVAAFVGARREESTRRRQRKAALRAAVAMGAAGLLLGWAYARARRGS